uniref:Uncharacterized protein n=1 Tax=Meloidogyne floridensis TaxID=298350 RepID=A0A915NKI4_9BILA
MQISTVDYIIAFDSYEMRANDLHVRLEILALNNANVFSTLQEDEQDLANIGYQVLCTYNPIYGNQEHITDYFNIMQLMHVYEKFEPFLIVNEPNNTYNLYELYYSDYVYDNSILRRKLKQYYINPQLRYQMINNDLVYNHQLQVPIETREGIFIPPQYRELYIPYPPPEAAGSVAESSQQAAGRRRPRDGNGNGGNGQRGRGRQRRNGGRNGRRGGNGDN